MAKKYPAIFALFAVISGILLADTFDISSWIYLFFGLSLIIVLIAFYFKGQLIASGVVALFCLAALSAYGYSFRMKTYPPGHIFHFVDDDYKYTVYGTIDDFTIISEHNTDVTIEDVGNASAFLCSDLASGITGEITYVDAGYNIVGMAPLD